MSIFKDLKIILGIVKIAPPKDMSKEMTYYEASMLYEQAIKAEKAPIEELNPNTMTIAETKLEEEDIPKERRGEFSSQGLTIIIGRTENPSEA